MPILLLLALPPLLWSAGRVVSNASTDVLDWLPETSRERTEISWYDQHFGTDQVLVLSWDGVRSDDDRVNLAAGEIRRLRNEAGEPLFNQIMTGPQVLRFLIGPMRVPREEALSRLDGWLVGPEGATAIVAAVSPAGARQQATAIAHARQAVASTIGQPASTVRVAGTTADAMAVDEATRQGTLPVALAALAIGFLMALLAADGLRPATPILISSGAAAVAALAAMDLLKLPLDGLSAMIPVLGFVLAASSTLHLDGYRRREKPGAFGLARALRAARWPLALSLMTSAVGFGALAVSGMLPVQRFALAAVATTGIVGLVAWFVWPALVIALQPKGGSGQLNDWFGRRARWLLARRRPIIAGALIVAVLAAPGLARLDSSQGIDRLLAVNHPLVVDYRWFERHVGDAVPVEVVVRFRGSSIGSSEQFLKRARFIGQLRSEIAALPAVGGAFAADTFMPTEAVIYAGVDDARLERRVDGFRKRSEAFALLGSTEAGDELWRVSARVSAFGGLDFAQLDASIGAIARKAIEVHEEALEARLLGGLPLVVRAQQRLLTDLAVSFGSALAVIAVGLMLLLRSARMSLLITAPNVLPVLVVFGVLGWAGIPVDVGLVMTASVALGLAVDNTAHLLAAFQRGLVAGLDRAGAAADAAAHVAPAALRTTLICALPVLVFAVSPFLPTARFGVALAGLMVLAVIVDLILLPLLLSLRGSTAWKSPGAAHGESCIPEPTDPCSLETQKEI